CARWGDYDYDGYWYFDVW
nr:immunoglobulin heavy chain junction region [Mus musculus]